jgi:uncharacterized protein (DUF305 family)
MRSPKKILVGAAIAAGLGLGLPVLAQQGQTQGGHSGHSMPGQMQGMPNMQNMSATQKEYHAVMQKMNQGMMQGMMESDPGKSWLKMMDAHHQGAIDMADIVMKHSKDQDIVAKARKTKEDTLKDQQEVKKVLQKHGS